MIQYKLSDLLDTKSGLTPPTTNKQYYKNGKIPWLTSGEISQGTIQSSRHFITEKALKDTSLQIIPKQSTLIAMYGATVGQVGFLTYNSTINQAICAIIPNEAVADPRYVYYYFVCNRQSLKNLAAGSARTNISQATIQNFPLMLPDMKYQHKIANFLSTIDKSLATLNDIKLLLAGALRLIYSYWFTQFDFPDENGRPYKSSGGKMIYDNLLKQEIPEGWKAVKFSSIAKIISGFPFKSDNYVNSGKYKVITIRNVQDGSIDSSTANSIDSLPDNLPDECVLSIDDLLISLTGNVGRCGLVFENNLLLNQRVGKLVVDHELNKDFAISTISSLQQRKRMEQLSNGSSQANLSPIQAADFYIALPPQALLNKFNSTARPARQLSLSIQQESKQLASLRDWLLPMLMNGQVEIRNDQ